MPTQNQKKENEMFEKINEMFGDLLKGMTTLPKDGKGCKHVEEWIYDGNKHFLKCKLCGEYRIASPQEHTESNYENAKAIQKNIGDAVVDYIDKEHTEEWKETFSKILLEYLDTVNLWHAALYNRPIAEITYPEFHRFYYFIFNLLAEKRKRVEEICAEKMKWYEGTEKDDIFKEGIKFALEIINKEMK